MILDGSVMSSRTRFTFLFLLPSLGLQQCPPGHRLSAVALGVTSSYDSLQSGKRGSDGSGSESKRARSPSVHVFLRRNSFLGNSSISLLSY